MNEREVFIAALQIESAEQRRVYLDAACGGDGELRRGVEALLAAHERSGSFLEHPLAEPAVTRDDPIRERPGTVIGPYKLMEQIGEGGMGLVFVAEQQQPIRRKVALKVIKPGMATRQVVARFEAERQALALMDHPNIAKVHDGGTTDSGRPYFVMELIKGVPITDYCDQNRVSIRQRLELFVSVCQAVQHAHQKGIIHRDLKPSNVMVMSHDGTPVVKIIDFGVAKAIGQQLTKKTIYTQFSQMLGTPLYMSPEQAGQSGLDVDTRSDIYSLGVLLYELLTGTTPFDRERMHELSYDEIRRIIREEEPPKPSTRLSTLGKAATTVSTQRQSEPKQLSRLIRGELDWIVMKALEKDRNRRYETANGFAMDLQRYLNDEPVQACPPSTWYRFGKYARKYKKMLATVAVFAALLVAATVISIGLASWALRERNNAEKQKQSAEANFKRALDAVEQMLTRVGEAELLNVPQMEPVRRDLLRDALRFYQEFLQERGDSAVVRSEAASAYRRVGQIQVLLGQRDEGEAAYGQAVALLDQLRAESPGDPDVLDKLGGVYIELGLLYYSTKRWPQAETAFRQAVAILEPLDREHPTLLKNRLDLATSHFRLIYLYREMNRLDEGVTAFRKSMALVESLLAGDPKNVGYVSLQAKCYQNVALVYAAQDNLVEAEGAHLKALALYQQLVGDHPGVVDHQKRVAQVYNNLGLFYARERQDDKAEAAYKQSLALHETILRDHPKVVSYILDAAGSYGNIANHVRRSRSAEASLEWYERAIRTEEPVLTQDPRDVRARIGLFSDYMGRGQALLQLGRWEEAERDWRRLLELSADQPEIRMRLYRPSSLAYLGEHVRATTEMETLLAEGQAQPLDLYNFSYIYSRCSAVAAKDARLLSAEREKLADQYGRRAVELLRRAQAAGYFRDAGRLARMKQNKDLDAIRDRDDFKRLVAELEAIQRGSVTNQRSEKK
jgi:eukaryotic-like serine/threonine-protein kinase